MMIYTLESSGIPSKIEAFGYQIVVLLLRGLLVARSTY